MLKSLLGRFTGGSASSFKIPIQPVTRTPYFVYLPAPGIPSDDDIRSAIITYWTTHSPADMCTMGRQFMDAGMLVPIPLDLNEFPACRVMRDVTAVQHPDLQTKLAGVSACLSLWASDSLGDPRVGLLFGRAAARAIAAARGGVALDAVTGEVLSADSDAPAEPHRALADEVVILPVPGSNAQILSPRTAGAAKYGIPEVQVADVPTGIEYHVGKLLLGAALAIGRMAEAEANRAGDRAKNITVRSPVTVTGEDVARAMGTAKRFMFTMAQKIEIPIHYIAPTQRRPNVGIPNYVPFLSDTDAGAYDGIIELRPPSETPTSGKHWVEELSMKLGLGASATGQ
jgi:hypothetical protein